MQPKFFKSPPTIIGATIILLVCFFEIFHVEVFQRLEWMTYDWRVREAARFQTTNAPDLGFLQISDNSIEAVNNGSLGFYYGLYWPRHIYGRILKELSAQGAEAVAFDVIFAEPRVDHASVQLADGSVQESDEYFANQIRANGRVILAAAPPLLPHRMFQTNAWSVGHIKVEKDSDGILRRDTAFFDEWHPIILKAAYEYGLDLKRTRMESNKIIFFQETNEVVFPRNADGTLNFKDFAGDPPPGVAPHFPPKKRIWNMGMVLAAHRLKLDLDNPVFEPGRIVLRGPGGVERVIPIDHNNNFYIEWSLPVGDTRLTSGNVETLLSNQLTRAEGKPMDDHLWKDKLIVLGSTATGNDLTDRGATPLVKDTFLASKHWNVANSILTGRFVQPSSLKLTLFLIAFIGIFSAWMSWVLKPVTGFVVVTLFCAAYGAMALVLFVQFRFWLPLILPGLCAGLITHIVTLTYRARVEQTERKRVKSIFSKIVAPTVVNELLSSEKKTLRIGGERRNITIYFADVRGFTKLTDETQTRAEEYIRENKLTPEQAEVYFDERARETLETVSFYLGKIADTIKFHNGTLDKYIGDCVMAFWGAPMDNPHHARDCVRAAIDSQRAIRALNLERQAENVRREEENVARAKMGLSPLPMLAQLSMGSGINSGVAIVGLMGSEAHILNYTVFGREVNLASRLEGVSGHGRIIIGETTFRELQQSDPALAATCVALEKVAVKGFRDTVQIYEVPWINDSATRSSESTKAEPTPANWQQTVKKTFLND